MADPTPSETADAALGEGSPGEADLAYELSGRLPCASCSYDLAGLSVLGRCPECGTLVRETLLVLMDPFGESVPKVRAPRRVAVAIVGCSASAFISVLCLVIHRVAALVCETVGMGCGLGVLAQLGVGGLAMTAICSVGLIIPMRATALRASIAASLGVICLAGVVVSAWYTLLVRDPQRALPYFTLEMPDVVRVGEHAVTHAFAVAAVVLLRPNARAVSSTAWRVRENHDNRQRLVTVAASLAAVLVGDVMIVMAAMLDSTAGIAVGLCGELLVFASSCILAIALLGVLTDSISIAKTLWRIPVAFRDVVRRAAS